MKGNDTRVPAWIIWLLRLGVALSFLLLWWALDYVATIT